MNNSEYKTIISHKENEIIVKKSRFICNVFPTKDEKEALSFIEEIKIKYKDARHNVWAFNLYPYNCRYSDDKEPKGTAGIPVLDAIIKSDVYDITCIVTRYFGGTLLGAPLLARTYSSAVSECLKLCEFSVVRDCSIFRINFSYNFYNNINNMLKKIEHRIQKCDFLDNVEIYICILSNCEQDFINELSNITSGECNIVKIKDYKGFI